MRISLNPHKALWMQSENQLIHQTNLTLRGSTLLPLPPICAQNASISQRNPPTLHTCTPRPFSSHYVQSENPVRHNQWISDVWKSKSEKSMVFVFYHPPGSFCIVEHLFLKGLSENVPLSTHFLCSDGAFITPSADCSLGDNESSFVHLVDHLFRGEELLVVVHGSFLTKYVD